MVRILTVATARRMKMANIVARGESNGWTAKSAMLSHAELGQGTYSDEERERERHHCRGAAAEARGRGTAATAQSSSRATGAEESPPRVEQESNSASRTRYKSICSPHREKPFRSAGTTHRRKLDHTQACMMQEKKKEEKV
jgi:hypothetical protein